MTDRKTSLTKLRDELRAGNCPTRAMINAAFPDFDVRAVGWPIGRLVDWILDPDDIRAMGSANALHQAVLTGFGPVIDIVAGEVTLYENVEDDEWEHRCEARASDPARAWLLSILEALIAQEDSK